MSLTAKHIPCRKCIGCREMLPKSSLIRIVKRDGVLKLDPGGKEDGRGAYICKNASCIATVKKKRGLERAFSMRVPEEIYTALESLSSNLEVQ